MPAVPRSSSRHDASQGERVAVIKADGSTNHNSGIGLREYSSFTLQRGIAYRLGEFGLA
jgi:hypothetical protein